MDEFVAPAINTDPMIMIEAISRAGMLCSMALQREYLGGDNAIREHYGDDVLRARRQVVVEVNRNPEGRKRRPLARVPLLPAIRWSGQS